MTNIDIVRRALAQIALVREMSDGIVVTTPCMYPEGGLVEVFVRGGPTTFEVSDNGRAVREAINAGIDVKKPSGALKKALAVQSGLRIEHNTICSPLVSQEALPVAIAFVANASKNAAEWLYLNSRVHPKRDFRMAVREFLRKTFVGQELKQTPFVGSSNKTHKFDSVISLRDGRTLLIDAVTHDQNAINSALVAHLDVKRIENPMIEQRIIYDDVDYWPADDLNLLTYGATAVPFSKSQEAFSRLAMAA